MRINSSVVYTGLRRLMILGHFHNSWTVTFAIRRSLLSSLVTLTVPKLTGVVTAYCLAVDLLREFLNLICSTGLSVIPTESTHISGNVLDLVIVTDPALINSASTCPAFSTSDHLGIIVYLFNNINSVCSTNSNQCLNWSRANYELANQLLLLVDWSTIFSGCVNVHDHWDAFCSVLNDVP